MEVKGDWLSTHSARLTAEALRILIFKPFERRGVRCIDRASAVAVAAFLAWIAITLDIPCSVTAMLFDPPPLISDLFLQLLSGHKRSSHGDILSARYNRT